MAGKCVSYENVVNTLRELSQSPQAKAFYIPHSPIGAPSIGQGAEMTLTSLETHPELAKLTREMVENASCSDIAQMVESAVSGGRDLQIAFAVDNAGHFVNNLANIPFLGRYFTHETTGASIPQYHQPSMAEKATPYMVTAFTAVLATVIAMHYGKRLYHSGKERLRRTLKQ